MFQEAFPILTAGDMARALGFYRDLLGCTVTYRFPAEGEPAYVGLRLGQSALGIGVAEPGVQHERAVTGDRFAMCVYAKACDVAIAHLRANGVAILSEPADQPWGERMAEVRDPDGNRVVILSRL